MSLRLIAMRHAKSSWGDPLLSDFERPLNERGHSDALAMGNWLSQMGYVPDTVVLSSSVRTTQTCACVLNALDAVPNQMSTKALYHAPDFQILRALAQAKGDTVLLIAHNPGIGDFVSHFASHPVAHPDFVRYPTCATTVFDVDVATWAQAKFGENRVIDFITPRELKP
ncbi:SixA phosphatase family protein [Celeribacter marinus]|uniref:Phosphohistidine phosphatase SixA n=1 Tax=Celeribacter marinus TaxID=1397108 RepID=A0A0P0ADH8_9RHOB|nr:histidine phosphatase family protein [Celeribacter marinus]ALI56998.1 phosphohistidine phosphatase SixA [Celeribacter marinus]SFK70747.1 phosphohistidine phosphatase [Celeribacter marinus]